MSKGLIHHRSDLSTIATWAMFSRGLQPEFPLGVKQQAAQFKGQFYQIKFPSSFFFLVSAKP